MNTSNGEKSCGGMTSNGNDSLMRVEDGDDDDSGTADVAVIASVVVHETLETGGVSTNGVESGSSRAVGELHGLEDAVDDDKISVLPSSDAPKWWDPLLSGGASILGRRRRIFDIRFTAICAALRTDKSARCDFVGNVGACSLSTTAHGGKMRFAWRPKSQCLSR
jgi:hypothetical protein